MTNITLQSRVTRNPEQEFSTIDNEVVMLNQKNGEYYALNSVGSRVWEIIDEPIEVNSVIEVLMNEFEVEIEICTNDTIELLKDLLARSLIIVRDVKKVL